MSLGFVVGESKPTSVTAITSRSLSVGNISKSVLMKEKS